MHQRRDATRTIWKTVVFAGAMLGGACGGKKAEPTTPAPATSGGEQQAQPSDDAAANPCATSDEPDPCGYDPCADPCGGRPRGVSDEGDVGRGFLLS